MVIRKKLKVGSLFDDFLKGEGIFVSPQTTAVKRILAAQLELAMVEKKLTKAAMAKQMHTSRAQLDRLLDPNNDSVTLATLTRAAAAVGRKLRLDLD